MVNIPLFTGFHTSNGENPVNNGISYQAQLVIAGSVCESQDTGSSLLGVPSDLGDQLVPLGHGWKVTT